MAQEAGRPDELRVALDGTLGAARDFVNRLLEAEHSTGVEAGNFVRDARSRCHVDGDAGVTGAVPG